MKAESQLKRLLCRLVSFIGSTGPGPGAKGLDCGARDHLGGGGGGRARHVWEGVGARGKSSPDPRRFISWYLSLLQIGSGATVVIIYIILERFHKRFLTYENMVLKLDP